MGSGARGWAGRLVAATGHLLEDVMVAHHSTWYCWRGCGNIQHPVCLPTASEDTEWIFTRATSVVWSSPSAMLTHFATQDDEAMFEGTRKLGRSLSAEKHMRTVFAMEAQEGPNAQDKAEGLMAVSGHLFEDMMATFHPPTGCFSISLENEPY